MNKENNNNNDAFVDYYAKRSLDDIAVTRSQHIYNAVLSLRNSQKLDNTKLSVLDIGCNAGTQSIIWAKQKHNVHGIDINNELVELAKKRALQEKLDIDFKAGSAEQLPWDDSSMDICLMPELLEHVPDWEKCIREAVRILKPSGTLYLSTTNKLCPLQEEFNIPFYSWYPSFLKKRIEKLAVTTRPELVNHAKFPAIHWFTYYQLNKYLVNNGFRCFDKFEIIKNKDVRGISAVVINILTKSKLMNLFGHMLTPYTLLIGTKN